MSSERTDAMAKYILYIYLGLNAVSHEAHLTFLNRCPTH